MPASPPPHPARGSAAPPMPPSVRVALGLLALLAVLLLIYVALTWLGRDRLIETLIESGFSRAGAERYLLVNSTAPLVLGLLHGVSAWALTARRPWSRWTGLAGSVVLALLILSTMLTAGGVTVVSLLLLVLSVSAAASLMAATTRDWLVQTRG